MFHRQASQKWNWRQKPEGNSSKNRWKGRMPHNCCCLGNLRTVIQQVCELVQPQCVACMCGNTNVIQTHFVCTYANGLLERSQARIGLHTFIEAILGMNKKNIEKEAQKYTSRLIVRLTPQLHKEIAEYAALCGLTTSAYARKRLEGKYPKQRLTDKEMEALNSLSDARGDIQKLFGFLKGRPLTERENILRSEIFMKRWRTSAEVILNRMIEIEKYLTQ